jgi:hypothetical protein
MAQHGGKYWDTRCRDRQGNARGIALVELSLDNRMMSERNALHPEIKLNSQNTIDVYTDNFEPQNLKRAYG